MKKKVSMVLALIMTLALSLTVLAQSPVTVVTNGSSAEFISGEPYISDQDATMVPLNYFDSLGIRTAWNEQTQTVTLVNGTITSGSPSLTTIGVQANKQPSSYSVAPVVSGKVPYVPLRSVANIYGLKLGWNGKTNTVTVESGLTTPVASYKSLILATTTSTQDSGLLDFLLPEFKNDTGIDVKTISVGTGAAIKMGADGEADVMLVHAKSQELEAMSAGHAISRHELMYNDFIIVGPENDPAGVKGRNNNAVEALKAIHEAGSPFISRGDKSGTDTLEKSLWAQAGITPDPKHYMEAATGMLATLTIAEERNGYTVTDRATYLKNQNKLSLVILCESDKALLNQYSVMVVNPNKNDKINVIAAMQFSDWLISDRAQALINQYGVTEYGNPLFFANYKAEY